MNNLPVKADGRGGQPGNKNALSHGLYSRGKTSLKLRSRACRRLADKAYTLCPWLGPQDRQMVLSWAETVKLKATAFAALERDGVFRGENGDLVGKRLLTDWLRLAQVELAFARELGLSPASRASLRVDSLEGDNLAADLQKARQKAGEGAGNE